MKYLVAIWASPLVLFWGWYFLSLNDINFGYIMLTRQVHDLVFQLYGEMLGIDPATIPGLVAKACVFDSFVVVAIWAFRRRRQLIAAGRALYQRHIGGQSSAEEFKPVEDALKDEGGRRRIDARFALLPGNVHLD
jgi:hypothetical protein